MTIGRHKNKSYMMCDGCGTELVDKSGHTLCTLPEDFDILIEAGQDAGWKTSRVEPTTLTAKAVWEHYCPDCQ